MERAIELSASELQRLFGRNDRYLEKIENELGVILVNRNGSLKISGDEVNVNSAASMIEELMGNLSVNDDIEEQKMNNSIELTR